MTDRDAQASPLAGAFDFTQPPRLDVPKLRERDCPTVRQAVAAVALLLALPLLIAARDPRGDVVACGSASLDASAPDLVAVEATAQELGTAAVWRLTFARPLVVPDPSAPPMRIDILVRDPKIPGVSVGEAARRQPRRPVGCDIGRSADRDQVGPRATVRCRSTRR